MAGERANVLTRAADNNLPSLPNTCFSNVTTAQLFWVLLGLLGSVIRDVRQRGVTPAEWPAAPLAARHALLSNEVCR